MLLQHPHALTSTRAPYVYSAAPRLTAENSVRNAMSRAYHWHIEDTYHRWPWSECN